MRSSGVAIAMVLAALVSGCEARQEPWGSVQGRVTLNGKPVANVTVLFSNAQRGVSLSAQSDAQGRFQIRSAKVPGIPVGDYRVAVIPVPDVAEMPQYSIVVEKPPPVIKSPVAPRYRDPKTTDLAATVVEGENQFEFAMQPN